MIGNQDGDISDLRWSARYEPLNATPTQIGYFHATYCDHPHPKQGKDLVLLDTRETEGGGDWSGSFIGTSFIFSDRANLGTLEGDPRFFLTTAEARRARAPAPKNGVAVVITGVDAT